MSVRDPTARRRKWPGWAAVERAAVSDRRICVQGVSSSGWRSAVVVTIATFDMMPDAHIALGRLRAEGIEARLADEHLVQTDWLYSIAVGGIKLQVAETSVHRALEILARDDSSAAEEQAMDSGSIDLDSLEC